MNMFDVGNPDNERTITIKGGRFRWYSNFFFGIPILSFVVLVVSITLSVKCGKENNKPKNCTTTECLIAAKDYMFSMDLRVDPCDNFYQYTCGKWNEEHPDHKWYDTEHSAYTLIKQKLSFKLREFLESRRTNDEPRFLLKIRKLYESCTDAEGRSKDGLESLLESLGDVNLPVLPTIIFENETSKDEDFIRWLETEVKIKRNYAIDTLIKFIVSENIYNTSENIIFISTPNILHPYPSFKKPELQSNILFGKSNIMNEGEVEEDYNLLMKRQLLKYFINEIMEYVNVTSVPDKEHIDSVGAILYNITETIDALIEKYTIHGIIDDDIISKNIYELQNMTDEYLLNSKNKTFPQFFLIFIEYMFENTNVEFFPKQDLIYFHANELHYFFELFSYLLELPESHIQLYMWWKTVYNTLPKTISKSERLIKDLARSSAATDISIECTNLVNQYMGSLSAYIIAREYPYHEVKPKVDQMLTEIKTVFIEEVQKLSWMDAKTKDIAVSKANEMFGFTVFQDWLLDNSTLERHYENMKITSNNFFKNLLTITKASYVEILNNLGRSNKNVWYDTSPNNVNAYNKVHRNSIYITQGILNFPLYSSALDVLAYGSLGTTLGHELIHGYDNIGSRYGAHGNLMPWWSNETIKAFNKLSICFIKQYNNFTIDGVDAHANGLVSLGENIADNGGLRQAYTAYRRHFAKYGEEDVLPGFQNFSNYQMFFIAYGSTFCETLYNVKAESDMQESHLPGILRLHGSVQNSEEFAEAFSCKKGSKMNPDRPKCRLW